MHILDTTMSFNVLRVLSNSCEDYKSVIVCTISPSAVHFSLHLGHYFVHSSDPDSAAGEFLAAT